MYSIWSLKAFNKLLKLYEKSKRVKLTSLHWGTCSLSHYVSISFSLTHKWFLWKFMYWTLGFYNVFLIYINYFNGANIHAKNITKYIF